VLVRPSSAGFVNPPEGNVISASPKVESVCAAKRPFVRDLFFITPILNEEEKQRLSLTVLGKGWVVRVSHSLPGSSPPSDPKEEQIHSYTSPALLAYDLSVETAPRPPHQLGTCMFPRSAPYTQRQDDAVHTEPMRLCPVLLLQELHCLRHRSGGSHRRKGSPRKGRRAN